LFPDADLLEQTIQAFANLVLLLPQAEIFCFQEFFLAP
jgi:hypothetical protein